MTYKRTRSFPPAFNEFCKLGRPDQSSEQRTEDLLVFSRHNFQEIKTSYRLMWSMIRLGVCAALNAWQNHAISKVPDSCLTPRAFLRRPARSFVALIAACSYFAAYRLEWWVTKPKLNHKIPASVKAQNWLLLLLELVCFFHQLFQKRIHSGQVGLFKF